MAVSFTKTDLLWLIQMIQMAESNTPPVNPHLPFGLREVAGTNNNQLPGQNTFGSADQTFPTMTQQYFQTVTVNGQTYTYATTTPGSPANFGVNVVDPSPRIISNLISDISVNNPAAVQAAQAFAAQLGDGYTQFVTNPTGLILPGADGVFGTADDAWGAGKDGIYGNADDLWGVDGLQGTADDLSTPDKSNLFIGNITPDAGLSAPFNSWMTFFGQFFDHGLDLITKGNAGVVMIPLAADDPLIAGADGLMGTADDLPASLRFMALTRATNLRVAPGADGIVGTSDDIHQNINTTTPFVDQNQTYTSHPSHQFFLREYIQGIDGRQHSTGRLLTHAVGKDGVAGTADDNSGMATWGDLKANALKFGLILQDKNVGNAPVVLTDAYGNYIPDAATGRLQLSVKVGASIVAYVLDPGTPMTIDQIEAATGGKVQLTGHAFLDDIAHTAAPWGQGGVLLQADADTVAGGPVAAGQYDNELLDAHYVAGDGRANENIALTAVHEIFHDEHNRLIAHIKDMVRAELATGDTSFALQWVLPGTNLADGIADNEWNGERLFQAAKFGTETQYQHLVFEEFARKVAPTIPLFGNVNINLDAAITSEFANAVYRFGHSMLNENVPLVALNPDGTMQVDATGQPVMTSNGLIQAFLNPLAFAQLGASGTAQIVQGNTHQIGSEIDEFVTGALRNNLLGLPLDLAALNIARGRDTGVAPLNLVRAQIYNATQDQTLKPYANWAEFGQFLKHEASLINFVAAYGAHDSIALATTAAAKRAAAIQLVANGLVAANATSANAQLKDAYDFMHSTGAYASANRDAGADLKFNTADDVWTGPNAGKALLNVGADLTPGTADDKAAMWATGSVTGVDNIDLWIGGLAEKQSLFGGLLGTTFNFIFETQLSNLQDGDRLYYLPRIEGLDFGFQIENNSFASMILANTGAKHLPSSIFLTPEYTVEAKDYFRTDLANFDATLFHLDAQGFVVDAAGKRVATDSANWLRNPVTNALLVEVLPDGTVHFIGDNNFFGNTMVLGGTEGNDRLQAGHADDDTVWGDGGDDWIDGGNGNDFLYGGTGNDTIVDSGGLDTIHGDDGDDRIYAGDGDDLAFGGAGNDYIEGGKGIDVLQGGLGNDIIKGGDGDDEVVGNAGDDWLEGGAGGDLVIGDHGAPTGLIPLIAGNDVLIGGAQGDRMQGFSGDDILVGEGGFDSFDGGLGFDWGSFEFETQGVYADMNLRAFIPDPLAPAGQATRSVFVDVEGISGSRFNDILIGTNVDVLAPLFNELSNVNLIQNLNTFFPVGPVAFSAGDIMLGGDGSDMIKGGFGNDIIDGDAYLHVELSGTGGPGSDIIRQIRWDVTPGDIDTAVYDGNFADYTINAIVDAEGFITVSRNTPAGGGVGGGGGLGGGGNRFGARDGTDKLRNIERIQFADRTIVIDTSPVANQLPTGTLVITGDTNPATPIIDPTVGSTLHGISTLVDPEGLMPGTQISYQWQMQDPIRLDWVNIAGATGLDYVPTNLQIGEALRLVATYVDGQGVAERVISAPTGIVLPNLLVNTAPYIIPQQGVVGLPDTTAVSQVPVDIFLPLITTFADHETAANLLTYTAVIVTGPNTTQVLDGSAAARGLTFTLTPDPVNGGILGAHITGTIATAGALNIRITASDAGPGAPLTVVDNFVINVQQNLGIPSTAVAPEVFANGREDTLFTGTLLPGTDPTNDPLAYKLVANSATNGTVTVNANGTFLFTPTLDFAGDATFKYYVTDGLYNSTSKTVTVHFNPVDDGTASVMLTGTAAAGGLLEAIVGADPDGEIVAGSLSFQWLLDGVAIGGETGAGYTVRATDLGHDVSVRVVYTDIQGNVNNGIGGNLAPSQSNAVTIGTVLVSGVLGAAAPTMKSIVDFVDPDGGPIAPDFTWQTSTDGVTWVAAAGTVGPDTTTFAPSGTTANSGAYVRAVATYLDDLGNIETVTGMPVHYIVNGNGGTTLSGTAAVDLIWGQGGSDQITAGAGNDFVSGGAGGDTIFASANDGDDVYDGGTGNDTYDFSARTAGASINLTAGTASSADTGNDQLVNIENVNAGSGDDVIVGGAGANVINGNAGNDRLTGMAGGDTLDGGSGNDTFIATLNDGNDTYIGGAGTDTIDLSAITSASTINLSGGFAAGLQIGADTLTGIENVIGGSGSDFISGSNGDNVLQGGAGNDTINGGGGNDRFVASIGDGNDSYNGQGGTGDTLDLSAITAATTVRLDLGTATGSQIGNDTISNIERIVGGSGADTITAGLAPEMFTGNGGADIFQFRTAGSAGNGVGNRTMITDFTHGVDKIDLSFLDANAGAGGVQHFTFAGLLSGAAAPAGGQIGYRYVTLADGVHTIIDGNIQNAGGNVDFQIDLLGHITLDAADFALGGP